jgi:pimeloyl-ACP methyl ester carboxylesterase
MDFRSFGFRFTIKMRALAKQYRVVAIDGPGVNLSSKPEDLNPYRLSSLVEQVDALARHSRGFGSILARMATTGGAHWPGPLPSSIQID